MSLAYSGTDRSKALQTMQHAHRHRLTSALDSDRSMAAHAGRFAKRRIRVRADHHLAGFGEALEPGGQVRGVTDRGEVAELFRADVADQRGPRVDPDAKPRPLGAACRLVDRDLERQPG